MVQLLARGSQGFKAPVCRLCVLQHLRPPLGFSAKKTHTRMKLFPVPLRYARCGIIGADARPKLERAARTPEPYGAHWR